MKLKINGICEEHSSPMLLSQLIETKQLAANSFAIAINQQFIPREQYAEIELCEEDAIEILTAMQGG